MTTQNAYLKTDLLNVGAWAADFGWYWNTWQKLEEGIYWDTSEPMTARRILKALRDWGYLTEASKGKLTIEDDGYNIVIMVRTTHEPVLALAYGEYLD